MFTVVILYTQTKLDVTQAFGYLFMLDVNKGIIFLPDILAYVGNKYLHHVSGGFKVSWDPWGSGDEIEL